MKRLIALSATLLLGACASAGQIETSAAPKKLEPYAADWRQKVAAFVRASSREPASIRDAQISEPLPEIQGPEIAKVMGPRWVVCVSLNSRNGLGGYTGRTMYHVAMRDGEVSSLFRASEMGPTCAGAKLVPFPEVNGKAGA